MSEEQVIQLAKKIAGSLDKLVEEQIGPGESADCSTLIDQLCNIADYLESIAGSLENISRHLQSLDP